MYLNVPRYRPKGVYIKLGREYLRLWFVVGFSAVCGTSLDMARVRATDCCCFFSFPKKMYRGQIFTQSCFRISRGKRKDFLVSLVRSMARRCDNLQKDSEHAFSRSCCALGLTICTQRSRRYTSWERFVLGDTWTLHTDCCTEATLLLCSYGLAKNVQTHLHCALPVAR